MKRFTTLALLAASSFTVYAELPRYQMITLGELPGGLELSTAKAINDAGVVVGLSHVGDGSRAFIWDSTNGFRRLFPDGSPTVSGLGGYQLFVTDQHSEGLAINNSGAVVGRYGGGFVYQSASEPIKLYSTVSDINDKGEILRTQPVLGSLYGSAYKTATDGTSVTLSTFSPTQAAIPQALNEKGQVVGEVQMPGATWDAVIWDSAGRPLSLNSRTDPYTSSFAVAINESGVVAGFRFGPENGSFIWTAENGMVDIGVPADSVWGAGGRAADINDAGVVIGNYGPRAYYWTNETGMVFLDQLIDGAYPGLELTVHGINNAGQIVGDVYEGRDVWRAVLLTPVPEAGADVMFMFGGIMAIFGARRAVKAKARPVHGNRV